MCSHLSFIILWILLCVSECRSRGCERCSSRGVYSHREKAKCADYSTNQPILIKKLDHQCPKAEPLYRYVSVWEIKTSDRRLTQPSADKLYFTDQLSQKGMKATTPIDPSSIFKYIQPKINTDVHQLPWMCWWKKISMTETCPCPCPPPLL